MSTMDRLADTLGDLDDILDQADEQTVTESLERGEAPDHGLAEDPDCTWCGHGFHGLRCYRPPQYTGTLSLLEDIDDWALTVTDPDVPWSCRCDSALTRLDDTWRPRLPRVDRKLYEHMDRTGLDGWAAHADIAAGRRFNMPAALPVTVDDFFAELLRPAVMAMGEAIDRACEVILGSLGPPARTPPQLREDVWRRANPALGRRISMRGLAATYVVIDEAFALAPADPLTPQARALQLRQTRNTGPERLPAGRARRPRRHGG